MSVLGYEQTQGRWLASSVLPPKADIHTAALDFRL